MTDPDVEREERIARDYLTQILRERCVAGIDSEGVAAHYIAWLRRDRRWKVALRPPPDHDHARPTDTEAVARTHRGAQLARRALAGEDIT